MVRISLEVPIPRDLVHEVTEKICFVSDEVRSCVVSDDGGAVELTIQDLGHADAAAALVRSAIDKMIGRYREIEKPVLWKNQVEPACSEPIWDEMVARGLVHSASPGCVSLLGDACRVADALEHVFATLAREVFAAVPHQYPVMVPIASMERCDYFASFPHHITFAPHLRENLDIIDQVAAAAPSTRRQVIADSVTPPTHILAPSVCFNTYLRLADSTVDEPQTFTAVNRCFRWESTANFATCERLWDFTMREIIFVGDPAWVEGRRQVALVECQHLVERLALDSWLETGNDPFFVGQFAAKRYFQLLTRAKYELRLSLPYSASSISAASFNVHEDFFGRSFQIRRPSGELASTGCVGFGLERWVWALFAQHGPQLPEWPAAVKAQLGL